MDLQGVINFAIENFAGDSETPIERRRELISDIVQALNANRLTYEDGWRNGYDWAIEQASTGTWGG